MHKDSPCSLFSFLNRSKFQRAEGAGDRDENHRRFSRHSVRRERHPQDAEIKPAMCADSAGEISAACGCCPAAGHSKDSLRIGSS
jgi:hypothetical protein